MRKRYWLLFVVLIAPVFFIEKLVVLYWTPFHSFDPSQAPAAPDYGSLEAWGVHPEKNGEALDEARMISRPAYVFFIHPTSLRSGRYWNEDLSDKVLVKERFDWIKRGQIDLWQHCCEVYAPHYRQATLASYWRKDSGGYEARKFAYQDILRAFDYFIASIPNDAPFILAGHSQGTEHGMRLIRERIYEKPLMERMIAAYLIGIPTSYSDLNRDFPNLAVCQDATQTACLINYATYRRDAKDLSFFSSSEWFNGESWQKNAGAPYVCVNPLSWKPDGLRVEASEHLGAVLETDVRPTTPAWCKDSVLYVESLDDDMGWDLAGNYHVYDIGIFHFNIAENTKQRIDNFYERKVSSKFSDGSSM